MSTTANASSEMINASRSRPVRTPYPEPLVPSRIADTGALLAELRAGARPNNKPVTTEMASANTSTTQSTRIWLSRGMLAGRKRTTILDIAIAAATPASPPILKRLDLDRPSCPCRIVSRKITTQLRSHGGQLGLRFVYGESRLQSRNRPGIQRPVGAHRFGKRICGEAGGSEHINIAGDGHARMVEVRLQNTNDGVRVIIESHSAANDTAIGAERATPERIADHNDRRKTGSRILRSEKPANLRRGTEHRKVRRISNDKLEPLRLLRA